MIPVAGNELGTAIPLDFLGSRVGSLGCDVSAGFEPSLDDSCPKTTRPLKTQTAIAHRSTTVRASDVAAFAKSMSVRALCRSFSPVRSLKTSADRSTWSRFDPSIFECEDTITNKCFNLVKLRQSDLSSLRSRQTQRNGLGRFFVKSFASFNRNNRYWSLIRRSARSLFTSAT